MIDEILSRITPAEGEKQEMNEVCRRLITLVKTELKDLGLDVPVSVYGSVSRDTWLSYDKDIDLFVRFPSKYSKKELEDVVTTVGKKVLTGVEKRFAEHPYVRGEFSGHPVEIVPCYLVEDAKGLLSAVDRTPFHDEFVKSKIGGCEGDVRLFKQFLRGIGCYGAEARVEGYSGYLCELLVIKYGSFEGVLKAASVWSSPTYIDLNEGNGAADFPDDPLIVIDPTDPNRNVASALSQQNYNLLIFAAKEYLKRPVKTFFYPQKRTCSIESLTQLYLRRGTEILQVGFQTPDVIDDILYSQLKKAARFFSKSLETAGFKPVNTGYTVGDKILVAFELENRGLSKARLHLGPYVNTGNEHAFIEKHRNSNKALTQPFIANNRWAVFVERKTPDAMDFLNNFLSTSGLKKKGVPSYIAASIETGFEITVGESIFENNPEFYTQFLDPRFPWEDADV